MNPFTRPAFSRFGVRLSSRGMAIAAVTFLLAAGSVATAQEDVEVVPVADICARYQESIAAGAQSSKLEVEEFPELTELLLMDCLDQFFKSQARDDGQATVFVDDFNNLVCAEVAHGGGSGSGCTNLDAPDPMILITGGEPAEPVHILVLDPARRLGRVIIETAGQREEITDIKDGGLWMQSVQPVDPDEILVLSDQDQELARVSPLAQVLEEERLAPGDQIEPEEGEGADVQE